MKKQLLKCGFVLLSIFSLTGCSYLYNLIAGSSNGGGYSYRSDSSSSVDPYGPASSSSSSSRRSSDQSASSSSSSIPVEDHSDELTSPSFNYMDYVCNNVYSINSTPCIGTPKILVVPVWFTDSETYISPTKKDVIRNDIEKAYFGTNEDTGWRSVKSYYAEESHGALTLNGVVSEWYECASSSSTYRVDEDASKTSILVKTVADWYFNNHTADQKDFDYDKDGYIDGIMLIYAAPDYMAMNRESYTNLWAYCFWSGQNSAPSIDAPVVNAFFWASYDFMYGSNASAKTGKTSYAGGDTRYCSIDAHTYIHEMGHMFGLEDYYDYSSNAYNPCGSFSMQDHNLGGHDPFSVYALGWGKAYIPTKSMTLELKPFTSSGEVIVLSPSFNTFNSPFDEYILLEYYTPTGLNELDVNHSYKNYYPQGANLAGIRVWHVDARLLYTDDGTFSANRMTTNPKYDCTYGVVLAMSNTYNDGTAATKDYLSILGSSYYNYNLLQMIRNSTTATYQPKDALNNNSLFRAGATFSMDNYGRQFFNRGKLNSNKNLGFTFTVDSIAAEGAVITINKL